MDCGAGPLSRIGTAQATDGRATPVLLFLPAGGLADHTRLMASLMFWADATILVPTSRWITTAASQLAASHRLVWVALDQQLASAAPPVLATPPTTRSGPRIARSSSRSATSPGE